jgi:hypothetical protein
LQKACDFVVRETRVWRLIYTDLIIANDTGNCSGNFHHLVSIWIVPFFRWIPLKKSCLLRLLCYLAGVDWSSCLGQRRSIRLMLVQATATSRYSSFVVLNLVAFCTKFVWSGYCKELQHPWSLQFWTLVLKSSSRSTNSFAEFLWHMKFAWNWYYTGLQHLWI